MRQIWIPKAGPPEVLEVREEARDPLPGRGQVRIRVEAAGVNFADIMGRLGLYPDLPKMPCVPGYEVAGRVDAVGDEVDASWIGKDVFALTRFGGYSDVACVSERQIFARPPGMSATEGAAIPVNYLTAYQLVIAMGGLRRGETVLVHSAGGGVGIAAIQLAKKIGARVIGTASASKHEYLRSIGVDHCIDYTREDFEARTKEILHGRGVELILDAVGGESFQKGFRLLAPTGRLGMFGLSAAATGKSRSVVRALPAALRTLTMRFSPNQLIDQNKGVFGVNLGHMWDQVDRLTGWVEDLVAGWREGVVKPVVAASFKFDDAASAHHFIQDRKNVGKVLLVP
jgi:NADPH:quinone reductase-like Zn-dependent oxidoreductase